MELAPGIPRTTVNNFLQRNRMLDGVAAHIKLYREAQLISQQIFPILRRLDRDGPRRRIPDEGVGRR